MVDMAATRLMQPAPRAQPAQLTIGRLAKAADVGIETIRYYQRRALSPQREPTPGGAFRHYPITNDHELYLNNVN